MSNQGELTDKQKEEVRNIVSSVFDTFKTSIQTEIKNLTELLSDPGLKQYLQTKKPGRFYEHRLNAKVNRTALQKDKKMAKPENEVASKPKKPMASHHPVHEHKPEDKEKVELTREKPAEEKPKSPAQARRPSLPKQEKQKMYKEPKRYLSSAENMSGALNVAKRGAKEERRSLQAEGKKLQPPSVRKPSRNSKLEPAKKQEEHEHKEGIKKEKAGERMLSKEEEPKQKEKGQKEIHKERRPHNSKEADGDKKMPKEKSEAKQPKEKVSNKELHRQNKANEQKQGVVHKKSGNMQTIHEHKEDNLAKKQESHKEISNKPIDHKKANEVCKPQELTEQKAESADHHKELEKKPVHREAEEQSRRKNLERKNAIDGDNARRLKKELKADSKEIREVFSSDKPEAHKDEQATMPGKQKEEVTVGKKLNKNDKRENKPEEEVPPPKEAQQHEELLKPQEEAKEGEQVKVKETKGQRRKRKRRNRKMSEMLKKGLKDPVKRALSSNYVNPAIEPEKPGNEHAS
eukprot:TRINITY_DN9404_c0_g1_i15.p1 TRINITY_DN9404_c0_g1~~TRINITY_DN9404_c0_g1_i15.p1  ORF type:complete len:518 (+),score=185.32 TRINITY_DN9404_c0_g1_i15:226-1779(+)